MTTKQYKGVSHVHLNFCDRAILRDKVRAELYENSHAKLLNNPHADPKKIHRVSMQTTVRLEKDWILGLRGDIHNAKKEQ